MFFGQQEKEDINNFIIEEWVSLVHVSEVINEEETLFLKGYGFIEYERESQFSEYLGFYLVKINEKLFGFCGDSLKNKPMEENERMSFKYVVQFDPAILKSSVITGSQFKVSKSYFKDFDADLLIEAKVYPYHDEEKLLLTKAGQGNIDLYCSYQIKNKTNEFICKIHPSAFTTAKYLAMTQILDQRIQNMKK